MIKSLVFITTICSLNVNSFNIQPKETQWSESIVATETDQAPTTLQKSTTFSGSIGGHSIYERRDQIASRSYIEYKTTTATVKQLIIVNYQISWQTNNDYSEATGTVTIANPSAFVFTQVETFNQYATFQGDITTTYKPTIKDKYGNIFKYDYVTTSYSNGKEYLFQTKEYTTEIEQARYESNYDNLMSELNAIVSDAENETTEYQTNTTIVDGKATQVTSNEDYSPSQYWTSVKRINTTNIALEGVYSGNNLLQTEEKQALYLSYFDQTDDTSIYNPSYRSSGTYSTNIEIGLWVNTPGQPTDVIDLAGLMWDIIGMPFSFLMQAFDVTLFPGTIYQFNIGTLFKGMIAILSILFVVKLFTRGIDVLGEYTGSMSAARDRKSQRAWTEEQHQMQRESHQMAKESHDKAMKE